MCPQAVPFGRTSSVAVGGVDPEAGGDGGDGGAGTRLRAVRGCRRGGGGGVWRGCPFEHVDGGSHAVRVGAAGDTPKRGMSFHFARFHAAVTLCGMTRSSDRDDAPGVSLSPAQLDALAAAIAAAIHPVTWLTPDGAAEVLAVPVATLGQWRYRGEGPRYSKVGKLVRYSRGDLDLWLAAAAVEPRYS